MMLGSEVVDLVAADESGTSSVAVSNNNKDDGGLNVEVLDQVCRLCLQTDELMICIYDRIDPNPNKRPLCDRVYELYQIRVRRCVFYYLSTKAEKKSFLSSRIVYVQLYIYKYSQFIYRNNFN